MLSLLLVHAFASPLNSVLHDTPDLVAVYAERGGRQTHTFRLAPGHSRHRGAVDPARHDIRSAAKSITSLAIAATVQDGLLEGLDVPVWPILGSTRRTHRDLTVRELLDMTSPLDCDDGRRKSRGNEERMYRRKVWRDFALGIPLDPDYYERPDGHGRFSYCTAGAFLLGQVVQEVSGERFDHYVQRRLFDPLGIHDVVWHGSKSGEIQSGGQLEITPGDLLKLGRLILDRGRDVLSAESLGQVLADPFPVQARFAYRGLFWFTEVRGPGGPVGALVMSGNGGNLVVMVPDLDTVVVVQSAAYNKRGAHQRSYAVVEAVLGDATVDP